jgi:hypothetical protein
MMFFVIIVNIIFLKLLNVKPYPIIDYFSKIKNSNTYNIVVHPETKFFVKINKKNSGYDERYPNENKNLTQINELKNIFEKKKLLDILKDDTVSILTKIHLINNDINSSNNINSNNILAGGLFKDFDFNDF